MTQEEILQTIKAEIISRIDKRHLSVQAQNELVSILSFLSDLESEKQKDELEEEIQKYLESKGVGYGGWIDGWKDEDLREIASHFAQWGAEH